MIFFKLIKPVSKVKFRQAGYCYKMVLEAAQLAYANKSK